MRRGGKSLSGGQGVAGLSQRLGHSPARINAEGVRGPLCTNGPCLRKAAPPQPRVQPTTWSSQAQLSCAFLLVIWFRAGHVAQFWPMIGKENSDFSRTFSSLESQCPCNYEHSRVRVQWV